MIQNINPLENYESYYKELKLYKIRLENRNNIIDDDCIEFVKFIMTSDRWIKIWLSSLNEIKSIVYQGNYANITRRVVSDYNEMNELLEILKEKNPIIKAQYPLNGSKVLKHIKKPETNEAKVTLPYAYLKNSLYSFYTPIIEFINSASIENDLIKLKLNKQEGLNTQEKQESLTTPANKHSQIFKNNAFDVWYKMFQEFKIEKSNRTDIKFMFEIMKRDGLIHDSVSQVSYLKWIFEEFNLDIIKTSSINLKDEKRLSIYNTAKLIYKPLDT